MPNWPKYFFASNVMKTQDILWIAFIKTALTLCTPGLILTNGSHTKSRTKNQSSKYANNTLCNRKRPNDPYPLLPAPIKDQQLIVTPGTIHRWIPHIAGCLSIYWFGLPPSVRSNKNFQPSGMNTMIVQWFTSFIAIKRGRLPNYGRYWRPDYAHKTHHHGHNQHIVGNQML